MANLIFDKVQIEATIDKIVDRTMRMDMTWDWPCGVAYYGICEAYEVTKNERYLQLVKDRVDEYIELGLPRWTVNTCSMGHCLITLYQHTGDEKYLNIAKSKVEYLEKEALRFGEHYNGPIISDHSSKNYREHGKIQQESEKETTP